MPAPSMSLRMLHAEAAEAVLVALVPISSATEVPPGLLPTSTAALSMPGPARICHGAVIVAE